MKNYKLSVVIPARNEIWLAKTIEDIVENTSEETEVIGILDGQWADPQIADHPRVTLIYLPESVGQRKATNIGVNLSRARFVAKCDAHCSFDKDFDIKMFEAFDKVGDDIMMVPVMNNLHAFNWRCYHNYCGWFQYQGPTPKVCPNCKKSNKIRKEIVWKSRRGVHSTSYCFDSTFHFQYFEDWKHRPQYIKDKAETKFTETMSLQGSFFMCTRERYWEYEVCDEKAGSWGNQGIELALSQWLSGGKLIVNHNTWYAHMFRTQGGDFSFPYEQRGRAVQKTKKYIVDKFVKFQHPKQIHPVSWLLEKFWPVNGWEEKDLANLKEAESKRVESQEKESY